MPTLEQLQTVMLSQLEHGMNWDNTPQKRVHRPVGFTGPAVGSIRLNPDTQEIEVVMDSDEQ